MTSRRYSVLSGLIIVTVVLAMGALFAAGAKSIKWSTDFKQAAKQAQKTNKPMMVDVYTEWCGWCKKLDKDTYSDQQVVDLSKKFVCVKVDGDKNADLVKQYNVSGYPTIVFLNSKGKEVSRVVGYQKPDEFVKSMQTALSKAK